MAKKYYWLQLKEDFFRQKEIKMLRRIAGGDTYTIIYLKIMLMSLKDEGKILYEGIGSNFAEEIALEIDEEVENVQITINYLMSKNLMTAISEDEGFMNDVPSLIGGESDSAKRVRKHRQIKDEQQKTLQCNADVTSGNTEIEIDIKKEIKNTRNSAKAKYDEASPYILLSKDLFNRIKRNNDEAKEPNYQTWADDFRKLIELDGKSVDNVRLVIEWCQQDSFWKANILSAKKLRDKYDQLKVQSGKFLNPGNQTTVTDEEMGGNDKYQQYLERKGLAAANNQQPTA